MLRVLFMTAVVDVTTVRKQVAGRLEDQLDDLESKVYAVMSGPIEIPRQGSPMGDAWTFLVGELGRYVGNFTVRGERLFVKSRRAGAVGGLGTGAECAGVLVDTLDAYLDRYDPGSVNVNDALVGFAADLKAIRRLRDARGTVRDGLSDPGLLAETDLELAALTGSVDDAVAALEADYQRGETVDVDPVGISDIAGRLYVTRKTVDTWICRRIFPLPRWRVSGNPAWNWPDVLAWAKETGRERNAKAAKDLEEF